MKRQRILCPVHEESTPSMVLYDTHGVCFGCGARVPKEELESLIGPTIASKRPFQWRQDYKSLYKPVTKENLSKSLERINSLPKEVIRGLSFPSDKDSYYIVYPGGQYYIKRLKHASNGDKYRGPSGHEKPLYRALYGSYSDQNTGELIVVEGQINALSAATALGRDGPLRLIVSPGGCSDLLKDKTFELCLQYDKICVIVDKDPPGVMAGVKLVETLTKYKKKAALYAMVKDLNDVLVEDGPEKVREEIKKALALLA